MRIINKEKNGKTTLQLIHLQEFKNLKKMPIRKVNGHIV